jgi:DNA-binding transcriptional MocR family regulator
MTTPSHQYPTGRVMSLLRAGLALIERARQAGAWIIEDDYDSEFRRAGPAPPALFGLQPGAPVVYVGTFSKTLYPGLRLGYLVLPHAIAADFARATARATRAGQGIEQRALADFIQRGYYTAHLRREVAGVAVRDAFQVVLVLRLGFPESPAGSTSVTTLPGHNPDALTSAMVRSASALASSHSRWPSGRTAHVVALPVRRRRIVDLEEELQQLAVAEHRVEQ